jgi:hypothetical protein
MAGVRDIRALEGRLHVNMHDPFNGFGPINLVDLGILPRQRLLDGLLDDSLTGQGGQFPTNLTGGLKGRGHPLGAPGMIQVVENHRLIRERGFRAGLSHSIGGPINNNVVILLERADHYEARRPQPFKPWGLPSLGRTKPREATVEALLGPGEAVEGEFVASTTRFHNQSGEPLNVVLIVSCRSAAGSFRYLFGLAGEHHDAVSALSAGDRVSLERLGGDLLINRLPVKRLYEKTMEGLVEMAGAGWKRLRGRGEGRP